VAVCCECCDEPSSSCATELVRVSYNSSPPNPSAFPFPSAIFMVSKCFIVGGFSTCFNLQLFEMFALDCQVS
jgi:hypothetical protein